MKNILSTLTPLLLIILLFSCGVDKRESYRTDFSEASASYDEQEIPAITVQKAPKPENIEGEVSEKKIERKLIKTGNIEFETENLSETNTRIISSVKKLGGYISNENEYNNYGQTTINLTVRIPSENFDVLLNEVSKGVTDFDNKNIDVKDVTEEFVDVQARIKTKKELETRYLQILEKAKTVKEIIEIERELGNLRADIESFEGRLKYLKNQVSFSTLDISFYELVAVEKDNKFGQKFIDGFASGWENLIWFFLGLTNIWPFILLIVVLIWFIRKRIITRRNRKKA
ncbi:MAG: DUF4349 domain-containing protein [Flavobacteriales bacterium]|nr:DUF4349 domain-containing protein [Flavobacteriales bacterium]MCB9363386.1 DUF4349 domain-containing protein [Flavobacteriales bacterium]